MTEKSFDYTIDNRIIVEYIGIYLASRVVVRDRWESGNMNGIREKMTRFMYGRYGADQLSRLYLGLAVVCLVLDLFVRHRFFYLAGFLLLVYGLYRSFSKNVSKMAAQNQKFLNWRYRSLAKWNHKKEHLAQRKVYCFYKCPGCGQKVRVPKGRGKIAITCPKCSTEFIKKS